MKVGAPRLVMEDCLEREREGFSTSDEWVVGSSSTMLGSREVVEVVEGRPKGDACDCCD